MAGAKSGVHVCQLKPVKVPELLIKGNKFIKWDEDSSVGVPVTLKVDPDGFILYWKDQHKGEMDYLDITVIRDTRTGKYAKLPKDIKLRDTVTMGTKDVPLEDKTLTVVYGTHNGSDLCNVNFLNFTTNSRDTAQTWTNCLFEYATNLLAQNSSPLTFLKKCYTKLHLITDKDGKIPVKNFVKMFGTHKDDKRKVEKAMEAAHFPFGKNDLITPSKFTFEDFMSLYRHLVHRSDCEKIFHELGAKKKPYLSAEQFRDFINTEQRDPRLNEILYPAVDTKKAQALIAQFEPNHHMAGKEETPAGHLSQEGFLRYLLSDENTLLPFEKLDVHQDMDQPFAHYFINSSHNTYLTGHQLTGRSSVEIYRQALLMGCRCVELDCWDGKGQDEEPIITHGFTMCTDVSFKEVIEAIAESAFKVSDFPVILSFENHCSPKQQAKMAIHCRNILGDLLLTDPLESNHLEVGVKLPSPEHLLNKILVKNKKRHMHKSKKTKGGQQDNGKSPGSQGKEDEDSSPEVEEIKPVPLPVSSPAIITAPSTTADEGESGIGEELVAEHEDLSDTDSGSDDDEDAGLTEEEEKMRLNEKKEKGTAGQEAEAGMEMSELVNYVQPVHFHSFDHAEKRNRSYECVSFVETQASGLLKEFPVEFVNYNKRQLSRIYPRGTRVDSSNYMPQIFWNAGCQLVALNYQTLDLAMQLNLGIFEYNGKSGYILKPDFMRRKDRQFDPFAESTVDGIVAGSVTVKIISGHFLSDKKVGTNVEVEMYGLPADTVRKKFRTKTVPANGINPHYGDEKFLFKKVVLPTLATLRIVVWDENGKMIGHRVLPVEGLRPGYRHITLRNELNAPLTLATLFVHIKVGLYVPDAFADFADALSNPIAYQSKLEKHAEQLAVLEEDFDVEDEQLAEQQVKEVMISQNRNGSVLSKQSVAAGDHTPQQLSRVGSLQNKVLLKQESTVSGMSLGSGGSARPVAEAENDGKQSGDIWRLASNNDPSSSSPGVLQRSPSIEASPPRGIRALLCAVGSKSSGGGGEPRNDVLNGALKCNSLPSSPLHAVKGAAAAVAGAVSGAVSGAVDKATAAAAGGGSSLGSSLSVPSGGNRPQQPKIDVMETTRLMDPEVVEDVTVEMLKEGKSYQKVLLKQEKELDALRKKHDKSRNNMQELHELQEEKLLLSQIKCKSSLEKTHRKSFKRASKHGNTAEIKTFTQQEISSLVSEQEKKHRELKREQVTALLTLLRAQYAAELELYQRLHPQLYDALDLLAVQSMATQMKRLDDIHDKEVMDLKKKLDGQNRDEMKVLAKKHKDKSELDRMKREARQKHITLAVQERQKLQDILEKRKGEVVEKAEKLKDEVKVERQKREDELQSEYDDRCKRLEEEHKGMLSTVGRASLTLTAPSSSSCPPSPLPPSSSTPSSPAASSSEQKADDISPTKSKMAAAESKVAAETNNGGQQEQEPQHHINEQTEQTVLAPS